MANIGALVVKLLLEKGQYKAELDKAVADTRGAAGSVQNSTGAIGDAVKDALQGQTDMATGAVRAMSVLGPVAGAAAVAAAAVALAYQQATKEAQAYETALILTGNVSGVNAGQMSDMARAIDQVVGTQGQAAAALAAMAGSGRIAGQDLQKFAQVALEMERTVGTAVGDTVKQFAELGNEPVKASLRLNETTNYLTASTYEQIKAAVELGENERAASIAQNAYADAMSGRTAQMEGNLGTLQKAWRGLGKVVGEVWDTILNVGRSKSSTAQLAEATANVERLTEQVASRQSRGLATGDLDRQLAAAMNLQTQMRETVKLDEKAATIKGDLARVQKAGVEAVDAVTKANERAAPKQEQMNKALDGYRKNIEDIRASNPESALLNPDTIAKTEAAIRKQYDTTAKGGKAAAAAASDYEKLMKRLGVDLPKAAAEAEAAQMGYNKSQTAFLALAASPEWAAFTNEQRKAVAAKYEAVIASELATDATKAQEKATIAATQAHEKHLATLSTGLTKLQAEVVAQQEHNERLGLTKEAIAALDAAKLEEQATTLEGLAIKKLDADQDLVQYALYQAQSKELRTLAALKRDGGAREAEIEATKEIDKENDRMLQSLDKTAHDVWVSVSDGGEDAFKRVGKTLKASILDVLYQMTVRKWIMNIGANITGSASGAAGAGGGMLGNVGSMASNLLGLSGVGSSFLGAASAGFSSAIAGATGEAISAGFAMVANSAGVSSALAGIGQIAGALGPWALAAAAVYGLVKKFDTSGTPHVGQLAQYSAAGGLATSQTHGAFGMGFGGVGYNEGAATLVQGVSQTIVGILDSTATAFGKAAGYSVATGFADDSSGDGAWGGLLVKQMGNVVANWDTTRSSKWAPREFADGEAGQKQYLAALAADTANVLKGMNLGGWANDILNALGASPSLETLATAVDQINVTKAALNQMGAALTGFASMSDGAISALIRASGGIEALAANASSYRDNFYSEAEKQATASKQVADAMARLNLQMPTTRDEYRALVEQYTAMGEAGAPTLAVLLALNMAFAAAVPAAAGVESLATALDKLRNPVRSIEDIARNIISLEDELFALQNEGNTAALRARALAGLSDTERAIQLQIYALQDQRDVLQQVTDAAQAAADAQADYIDSLSNAGGGIAGLIRELTTTQGGTAGPMQLMRQTQANYLKDLALARAGDVSASERIAQSARDYIDASGAVSASATQAAINAQVVSELKALPATRTYEQKMLDELVKITDLTARQLSAQNIANTLLTNFGTFDLNLDGLLTFEELKVALQGKASDAELRNLFWMMDANGDGTISQLELVNSNTAASVAAAQRMSNILLEGFSRFDLNLDGLLTFAELQAALAGKASDAELRNLFWMMDANGDGTISQLELVRNNTLAGAQAGQTLNAEYIGQSLALLSRLSETSNVQNNFAAQMATQLNASAWVQQQSMALLAGLLQVTALSAEKIQRLFDYNFAMSLYDVFDGIQQVLGGPKPEYPSLLTQDEWDAYFKSAGWDGGFPKFAQGGVFTNSIVDRPTNFSMGQMGEAGPEAIMPLERGPGGDLGVRMYGRGPYASLDFADMAGALASMATQLAKVSAELAEIKRGVHATAAHTADTKDGVRTLNRDGLQVWNDPKEPLSTKTEEVVEA